MIHSMKKLVVTAVCALFTYAEMASAGLPGKTAGLQEVSSNDRYRPFLIDRVFNYFSNTGMLLK